MAIEAVLFDADGVLQQTPGDWLTLVAGLCGDSSRTQAFLTDVFAAEAPAMAGVGDFAEALADVLRRWQSKASVAEALAIWALIEPDHRNLAMVRDLRLSGIRVGLATNQQAYRARVMSADLEYANRFDDLFYSCVIGAAKPDPRYFAAVLDRLGLPGEQVLFIDDREANVTAARSAGLVAEVYALQSGADELRRLLGRHGLLENR